MGPHGIKENSSPPDAAPEGILRSSRGEKMRNFWKRSKWKRAVLLGLSALAVMMSAGGCGTIGRVQYQLSGAGVESWEEAAAEAGIETLTEEYYYENLPEDLREAYREMYVRIMRNEDSAEIYSEITTEDFWKVYYGILADHPEIFWIGKSVQVQESGLTGHVVSYEFETTVPQEERETMRGQLEAAADACLAGISQEASTYEKIKYVYEYIINSTDYNENGQDTQNIQSVLLYHSSVCAGYSKAFQYLLNRMGLFCTYITGTIRDGGDHGWNLVRIDDSYYYVDVTWGDPVFANQMEGQESTVMNYNYLCCTEEDLFKTHEPDGTVPLPPCTSQAYNYYMLNGMYYETFDYDTIYNRLMESVWNGDASIVMKYGSQEAYDTAVYEILEGGMLNDAGQYLMEQNGVSTWNYRYQTDDNFFVFTLYWQ